MEQLKEEQRFQISPRPPLTSDNKGEMDQQEYEISLDETTRLLYQDGRVQWNWIEARKVLRGQGSIKDHWVRAPLLVFILMSQSLQVDSPLKNSPRP